MSRLLCLVSGLILAANSANSQTQLLVSRNAPVTVVLTGAASQSISSNASKLTDGIAAASNFYELPAGNEGSRILITLNDLVALNRVEIRTFLLSAKDFRLRGYELRTSVDSLQWTLVASDSNVDTTLIDVVFEPLESRFFELTVTRMDTAGIPETRYSTALTEISLWALIDRPTISFSQVTTSLLGAQYRDIHWSSVLWDTAKFVNISYWKSGTNDTTIIAKTENDGQFSWLTEFVPDGSYVVHVQPDTVPSFSSNITFSLANFSQTSLRVHEDGVSPYGGTWPVTYASLLQDSVELEWTYTWLLPHDHEQEFAFSPDSGVTWNILGLSADSSRRSMRFPTNALQQGARDGLFRLNIKYNGEVMRSITTTIVVQVPGLPPNASYLWARSIEGEPLLSTGLLAYGNGIGPSTILGGYYWLVRGNGDSVTHWTRQSFLWSGLAAGDLDNNGVTDIITFNPEENGISVVPDTSSPDQPTARREVKGKDTHLVDFNNDGFLDIISFDGYWIKADDRHFNNLFTYFNQSGWSDALPVNISGDDRPEIVAVSGNTVFAYNQVGQSLPGFPTTFATLFNTQRITPLDVDEDGYYEFLVGGFNYLYCLTGAGTVVTGFPVPIPAPIMGQSAIGDIDGDGHLDIVYVTGYSYGSSIYPPPTVHCVDRHGVSLPGWPVILPDRSLHRINYFADGYLQSGISRIYLNAPANPLIGSIDGDVSSEILITTQAGELFVLNGNGSIRPGYPVFVGTRSQQSGVLGDFDNNGSLNYVIPLYFERPNTYALFNIDFGPGTFNANALPWPMDMQNSRKTRIAPPAMPVGVAEGNEPVPAAFSLSQNYPNPFNPSTTIRYDLPRGVHTTVRVLNILGQSVATLVDEFQQSGTHVARFDGTHLASGVYFVHITAGANRSSRKMLFMK